ncbi:putative ABC transport system permease protein [Clostridium algifaecis]|uniref:ABC transport system permease protein n=1 Tax=Clostridium algifaecis TaxID=1472040 RepID=A0ABS4KS86_9CLOT|nr:FtsX-like permease family protein [Clostridium algifaecis]MBP2032887.1 putative ABC transport system permease protein [Clostridium algifaecis]
MRILKKYLRKTQFLILSLTFILIFTSIIVGHVEKVYRMILEANNFKTINSVAFNFNEKNLSTDNIIKSLKEMESQKNIIIIHEAGRVLIRGASQFGIYFNGIYENGYNLLEGRFFNLQDFKENKKVVVVGKNLINSESIQIENGRRYIYRGNDKFLVIGVIGKKNSDTQYDSRILYNLNIELEDKDTNYLQQGFILDSTVRSESSLKNIINRINRKNNSTLIKIIYQDKSNSPLVSAIQNSRTLLFNFSLIILCIIITLVRATIQWIDKISLELGIRRMYGCSNKNIILHIAKRYLSISVVSLVIAIVFQNLLILGNVLQIQNSSLNKFNIIASFIFILIIGSIVIGISIFNINKTQISYLIKGKV